MGPQSLRASEHERFPPQSPAQPVADWPPIVAYRLVGQCFVPLLHDTNDTSDTRDTTDTLYRDTSRGLALLSASVHQIFS
jgi:hypothetical protein